LSGRTVCSSESAIEINKSWNSSKGFIIKILRNRKAISVSHPSRFGPGTFCRMTRRLTFTLIEHREIEAWAAVVGWVVEVGSGIDGGEVLWLTPRDADPAGPAHWAIGKTEDGVALTVRWSGERRPYSTLGDALHDLRPLTSTERRCAAAYRRQRYSNHTN